ncbi:MAG: quinoprotein relay system zinc metallohydrolase 2 [Hyphomicrobiaceae bacterium]
MTERWLAVARVPSIRSARALALTIACVTFVAAVAASSREVSYCGGGKPLQPAEVQEVAPGVFVRQGRHELMTAGNQGGIANIGFIVGRDAVAVVDTGGSACDGARLRTAIAIRTKLPIRYVINTHVHPDHIFGNVAFRADGPEFIGQERLPRALAQRGEHYLSANRRLMGEQTLEGTEIIGPKTTVADERLLDLGERQLLLTAHEVSHTDNDLTVLDVTTRTLWSGDLIFVGHTPVVDGSLLGLLAVGDKLGALEPARVVPGHGPAAITWPDVIAPQQRYLEKLASDLRQFIKDGRTMSDAVAHAAQAERGSWQLFDEFNPRNATAGFAELEWE